MGDKGAMSSDKAVEAATKAACLVFRTDDYACAVQEGDVNAKPPVCSYPTCACKTAPDGIPAVVDAAIEVYAKSLAQDGWRDIATAPKDGTRLLLWNGQVHNAGRWNQEHSAWVDQFFWPLPTHWMPLPAAPNEGTAPTAREFLGRCATCLENASLPNMPCATGYGPGRPVVASDCLIFAELEARKPAPSPATQSPPVAVEVDLEAIEQRANAATPGPWQARFMYRMWEAARRDAKLMFNTTPASDWADAEFCAEARTDIPALLSAYRALKAGVEEMRREYDEIADVMSCVIDHATGGKASKLSYTKEVYYGLIQEHMNEFMEMAAKEAKEEAEAALEEERKRADLAEAMGRKLLALLQANAAVRSLVDHNYYGCGVIIEAERLWPENVNQTMGVVLVPREPTEAILRAAAPFNGQTVALESERGTHYLKRTAAPPPEMWHAMVRAALTPSQDANDCDCEKHMRDCVGGKDCRLRTPTQGEPKLTEISKCESGHRWVDDFSGRFCGDCGMSGDD